MSSAVSQFSAVKGQGALHTWRPTTKLKIIRDISMFMKFGESNEAQNKTR